MAGKNKYHHGHLRKALIDAAAQLCSQKGPEMLSLRETAKVAAVSHSAPYHHFASKADLLHAVGLEGHRLLEVELKRAVEHATEGTPYDRLAALGHAYIRFAAQHPHYFKAMFRTIAFSRGQPTDENPYTRSQFDLLVASVQACLGESGSPSPCAQDMVLLAWSVVHGLASLWTEKAFAETSFEDESIETLAGAVTRAIRPVFDKMTGTT